MLILKHTVASLIDGGVRFEASQDEQEEEDVFNVNVGKENQDDNWQMIHKEFMK